MASQGGHDDTGRSGSGHGTQAGSGHDLDRRRRELEAKLATRRPASDAGDGDGTASSTAGFGSALKLSSEFIAGIVVGVGMGWLLDTYLGTSPWGLIVFLFLGFGAGVLNVLRSAGRVAEFGQQKPRGDDAAGND